MVFGDASDSREVRRLPVAAAVSEGGTKNAAEAVGVASRGGGSLEVSE
jgi:hypothetical protein